MLPLEERVTQDHPLRQIRPLVDEIFRSMSTDFDGLYASTGRPSVPPERLLRALLLQIFYSVRSEQMLIEQLNYNRCSASSWACRGHSRSPFKRDRMSDLPARRYG